MYKIFIYGVPSGGLFGLRQLRKAYPTSLIYVFAPKTDIGFYSNKYDKFIETNTKEQMRERSIAAYKEVGGGNIFAFIYSNRMLEYLVDGNQGLFELLTFENPYEVYQTIVDKKKADLFCRVIGLKRPDEYHLKLESDISRIKYPVVIKPLEKQKAQGVSKCEFIKNRVELDNYLTTLEQKGVNRSNVVCQQLIFGNNEFEFGYGGYFVKGNANIDVCFYQFRQMPQGLSCYIREITEEKISNKLRHLVMPFLEELQYTGFIEFDIKQDSSSKDFYILDINPRPWGSSDMLNVKLKKSTVFNPILTNKKIVWRKPFYELFAFSNKKNTSYILAKKMTGYTGFGSALFLWDWSDCRPFFKQIRKDIYIKAMSYKNQQ